MARKKHRSQHSDASASIQGAPSPGKLVIQAQYDAARQGRRLAGWNPPSTGPNRAIAGLQTIRNRSRDAGRNEWAGSSTIRNLVVDIVGTGIIARPKTKKATLKAKLTELWDEWIKYSDADGVQDFYGQEALAARTWEEAGEVFVRLRPRRLDDGLRVPLQIQLIEPELCPAFDRDLPNGNRIRQGIELDRIGRRVAYWMYKEHPGDYNTMVLFNDLQAVPASEILHVYEVKRPGQMRGVPEMAPTLVKMKTVGDYDDAVTEKAKLQNLYVGVIKKPAPIAGMENYDPLTGQTIDYAANGQPMVSMEPGAMLELAPGEDIEFSNPPATGVGYNDFMRQQNLGISGGSGVPYEIMTGDIVNVSDRTLRVVIQQYRRSIEQKQWLIIIPMLCQKIRDAWVDAAVLAGEIAMMNAADAKMVDWSPQAWAYIHPVQDVQSKQVEIATGITSRSAVISARGYDPEQVDAERAADLEREKKLGITPEPPPVVDPNKQTPEKKAAATKAKAETDLLNAQAAAASRMADAEVDRAKAYAQAQADIAASARAENTYHAARADQAIADSLVAEAQAEQIRAQSALDKANAEATTALATRESETRIAECLERAEMSRTEAEARATAMKDAEAFAAEQRVLVLAADKARTEAARLEVEAAQLGLEELRAG